jgi:hypothetical protein
MFCVFNYYLLTCLFKEKKILTLTDMAIGKITATKSVVNDCFAPITPTTLDKTKVCGNIISSNFKLNDENLFYGSYFV